MKGLIDSFAESFSNSEENVQLLFTVLEKYDLLVRISDKLKYLRSHQNAVRSTLTDLNLKFDVTSKLKENANYSHFHEYVNLLEKIISGTNSPINITLFHNDFKNLVTEYNALIALASTSEKAFETYRSFTANFVEFYFLISYLTYQINAKLLFELSSLVCKLRHYFNDGQSINKQLAAFKTRIDEINSIETYIEKASSSFAEKFSSFEAMVNKNSESYNKYKKEVDQMNLQVGLMQAERQSLNELCENLCNEYEQCLNERKAKRLEFDEQSKIMLSLVDYQATRNVSIEKATAKKKQMENLCYTLQAQRNNATNLLRKYKEFIDQEDVKKLGL